MKRNKFLAGLLICLALGFAGDIHSQSYNITVDAAQSLGTYKQFWNGIGHSNFNDGVRKPYNEKMFELMAESNAKYKRKIFKWFEAKCTFSDTTDPQGSVRGGHVYSEDAQGNPVYYWGVVDSVIDVILKYDLKPVISFSFMPRKLASDSTRVNPWHLSNVSPPKDYNKWRDLIFNTVKHLIERYGVERVRTWYFEVWNEPDLYNLFWVPHPDTVNYPNKSYNFEYFKLYDYTADGAVAADSSIQIGGPAIAGDIQRFINEWLPHCTSDTNYATGNIGSRVDFISRHNYGDIQTKIYDILKLTVDRIKKLKGQLFPDGIRLLVTEFGPSTKIKPWLNTRYVAAWLVKCVDAIFALSDTYGQEYMPEAMFFWTKPVPPNFSDHFGIVTALGDPWMPTPEGVVKRPVYNAFEMLGQLDEERIALTGTNYGDEVHGIATKDSSGSIKIILYHLKEDDFENLNAANYTIQLTVSNIPFSNAYLEYYKIDENFSNGYTVWKQLGEPVPVSSQQLALVKSKDDLELVEPISLVGISNGTFTKTITLQNNSVAMLILNNAQFYRDVTPPAAPTGVRVRKN